MAKQQLQDLEEPPKSQRRTVNLTVTLSHALREDIQKLVDEGYFSSASDLIRYAVHRLIAEYRAQGKLKAKPAEEIVKEIELKKHKPVKEEDLGEEVIR